VTTKELLEIIILIIGGGGAAATAGFAFAVHQEKQKLNELRLEIKDAQLEFQAQLHRALTAGQTEFARKVQKNIDSNQVEIGILKGEVDDIKGMIKGNYQIKTRSTFPPENKPKHTGWTIEDA
jgi:iron uptake system EfeUOB component EfeO/EfeM